MSGAHDLVLEVDARIRVRRLQLRASPLTNLTNDPRRRWTTQLGTLALGQAPSWIRLVARARAGAYDGAALS